LNVVPEPRPLPLMVRVEADAQAYSVACWRAEEASSEMMVTDWREVALTDCSEGPKAGAPEPYGQFGSFTSF
jgi:hypothetical protein